MVIIKFKERVLGRQAALSSAIMVSRPKTTRKGQAA